MQKHITPQDASQPDYIGFLPDEPNSSDSIGEK